MNDENKRKDNLEWNELISEETNKMRNEVINEEKNEAINEVSSTDKNQGVTGNIEQDTYTVFTDVEVIPPQTVVENFVSETDFTNETDHLSGCGNMLQVPMVVAESEDEKENKTKSKKKSSFLRRLTAIAVAAILFGAVTSGAFLTIQNRKSAPETTLSSDKVNNFADGIIDKEDSITLTPVSTGTNSSADVSTVIENVMPAIVAINCTAIQTSNDWYGRGYQQEVSGSGSGFIIGQNDSEVLIATNNHVIENATTIEIVFNDGSKAEATVKGTDGYYDLAVVAVKTKDLSADTKKNIKIAALGDSDTVEIGELAIAIGNALGFGQSVTVGHISALDREIIVDNRVAAHLIQTDAAINEGNSGGALLNEFGEVIGINSNKVVDVSAEGIGYAIPISEAIPIINDLMNREELKENEKGYLGITCQQISESFANEMNMPYGVYIASVGENTPAEKAGLHEGDVIIGINGRTVTEWETLKSVLEYTKAGSTIELKIKTLENGSYVEKTLEITLAEKA